MWRIERNNGWAHPEGIAENSTFCYTHQLHVLVLLILNPLTFIQELKLCCERKKYSEIQIDLGLRAGRSADQHLFLAVAAAKSALNAE